MQKSDCVVHIEKLTCSRPLRKTSYRKLAVFDVVLMHCFIVKIGIVYKHNYHKKTCRWVKRFKICFADQLFSTPGKLRMAGVNNMKACLRYFVLNVTKCDGMKHGHNPNLWFKAYFPLGDLRRATQKQEFDNVIG